MANLNKIDAFATMLAEVKDPAYLFSAPAYVGLIRLATLAGRLPFRLALASLTPWEANLVQSIFGHDEITFARLESSAIDECNILITFSSFGKLSLYDRFVEMPAEPGEIVAGIRIDSWLLDKIEDECEAEDLLEKQERQQLDEMLFQWEAEGVIGERIDQFIDLIERIDNVFLYIERQIFSKSDIGSNTLVRDGLLQQLKEKSVIAWTSAERLCVAALYLFFLTGRFVRIEEFNGHQLTASNLQRWLIHKLCLYSAALGENISALSLPMSLSEIAKQIGQLTNRMAGSDWIQFRRINGITLFKKEYFTRLRGPMQNPTVLPPLLANFAAEELGVELDSIMDPEQSIEILTAAALQNARQTSSTECLERIVEKLVLSSILESEADYGMSSSIRNPSRLKGNDEARGAGSFSLTKEDFFCCVLPHPNLVEVMPPQVLYQTLYSSALRMQFNRWHFIPGNFPRIEIPLNRHYFFPPRMSDIAEWSDLRHAGHIAASVRYTIRAPGPALWREPLFAFGHPYYGFYDIRLVRIEGPPFEKHHMRIANYHCALIGAFWRAVLRFIEKEEHTLPIINVYTRDWYMAKGWQKALKDCLAVTSDSKQ